MDHRYTQALGAHQKLRIALGVRKTISQRICSALAGLAVVCSTTALSAQAHPPVVQPRPEYLGFDRNLYPGDAALAALRKHFDFVAYWVTNPPGERQNSWLGRRATLAAHGFGFAVLADGRTDAEIVRATRTSGSSPAALGEADADAAVAATRREGFRLGTVLFLDQEEGGRMLPEQADYLLGWTERVAHSGLRPGVYLSGQRVADGAGKTITTAEDVPSRIAEKKLTPVVLWVYQDACPPSNGCSLRPPPLADSGTPEAVIWQYAQSPRRPQVTRACAQTYAANGDCILADLQNSHERALYLDLNLSSSPDPSAAIGEVP